jgi:hypothetical protein
MSTATEVGELHQLIAGLRVCVTSLVSTYGDCPAMLRVVNDAECILNGIHRLGHRHRRAGTDERGRPSHSIRRDDPDPGHPVRQRLLARRRPRGHRRTERRLRGGFTQWQTQIGKSQCGGNWSAPFSVTAEAA